MSNRFGLCVYVCVRCRLVISSVLHMLNLIVGRTRHIEISNLVCMLRETSLKDWKIENQTKLNQSKPNQTRFPLNTKFSVISYPIFIKIGMVISVTLWQINMHNLWWLEYACVHSMHKCACMFMHVMHTCLLLTLITRDLLMCHKVIVITMPVLMKIG